MKNFELKRFGRVLRRDILENRKKTLRSFAALYLANFAVIGSLMYTPTRHGLSCPPLYEPFAEQMLLKNVASAVMSLFGVLTFCAISQTFANLRTKQLRIANLMLPATNLEKFLSRLLQSTAGYVAAFFVAFVLADLTRMLLFPLLGHSFGSVVACLVAGLYDNVCWMLSADGFRSSDLGVVRMFWVGMSFSLWSASFFLLGSAVFRRRAFLYTLLACFALLVVFVLGIDLVIGQMRYAFKVSPSNVSYVAGLLTALACFNVWLSYRLFCRIQVIPRKLFRR